LSGVAGVWFGGRRVLFATRQGVRRIVREELEAPGRPLPVKGDAALRFVSVGRALSRSELHAAGVLCYHAATNLRQTGAHDGYHDSFVFAIFL
jgi:hypothetical protein